MFSCSHFLSNRKQSVISKRTQDRTAKGGSAAAKPRPMELGVKERPERKENPSPGFGCFEQPCVRKLVRNNSKDPTSYSQERRQDHTPSSGTRKLVQSGESASSASTRKLMRCDSQIERTRLEFHCKSPTIDTLRKFSRTCGKVEFRRSTSTRLEDQRINLGIIFVDNDESRCSSWTKLHWKFWKYTGTQTSKSSRICSIARRD